MYMYVIRLLRAESGERTRPLATRPGCQLNCTRRDSDDDCCAPSWLGPNVVPLRHRGRELRGGRGYVRTRAHLCNSVPLRFARACTHERSYSTRDAGSGLFRVLVERGSRRRGRDLLLVYTRFIRAPYFGRHHHRCAGGLPNECALRQSRERPSVRHPPRYRRRRVYPSPPRRRASLRNASRTRRRSERTNGAIRLRRARVRDASRTLLFTRSDSFVALYRLLTKFPD